MHPINVMNQNNASLGLKLCKCKYKTQTKSKQETHQNKNRQLQAKIKMPNGFCYQKQKENKNENERKGAKKTKQTMKDIIAQTETNQTNQSQKQSDPNRRWEHSQTDEKCKEYIHEPKRKQTKSKTRNNFMQKINVKITKSHTHAHWQTQTYQKRH